VLSICSLLVLVLAMVMLVPVATAPPVQAQSAGNITSSTQVYSPPAVTISGTCATTACPTFILGGGLCTATVRITGATTIVSTVKVSNDGGANYSQITPLVVGVAANGTITTNNIAANGIYSMTLATMNRVRFEQGTFTGGPATLKLVASGNCISQVL